MVARNFKFLCDDEEAQQLLIQLAVLSPNEHGFSLHQGLIRRGDQI
jgi:hypothetical protein